jgi:hypothetical protein
MSKRKGSENQTAGRNALLTVQGVLRNGKKRPEVFDISAHAV